MKPELSDPIAIRLPKDVLARLEAIARVGERTRSWVMVRALRLYLDGEGKDILAAARGRAEAAAGEVEDMADVVAEAQGIADGKVA